MSTLELTLSDAQKQKYESLARDAIIKFRFKMESPELTWTIEFTKPEMNLTVYSTATKDTSYRCFKGVCEMPYDSVEVLKFATDCAMRPIFDPAVESMSPYYLQPFVAGEDEVMIIRSTTNRVGPVSSREFFDAVHRSTSDPDGTAFCVGVGIDDVKDFPENKNYVRGVTFAGLFCFSLSC